MNDLLRAGSDLERRLLEQIIVDASNSWRLAMMCRSPRGIEIYDLMRTPRVGDLVVEMSTGPNLYQDGDRVVQRRYSDIENKVGRLKVHEHWPIVTVEEWTVEEDGPVPLEEVWVIERLTDGGQTIWRNANFIRLPEGALP